jgi:hypothetical protein
MIVLSEYPLMGRESSIRFARRERRDLVDASLAGLKSDLRKADVADPAIYGSILL